MRGPASRGRRAEGSAEAKSKAVQRDQMMNKLPPAKHFANGQKSLNAKQYDRAKEAFRYAVAGDDTNPSYRAYYAYSRYLSDPTEIDRVLKLLRDCLDLPGPHIQAHLFTARVCKADGRVKRAMMSFSEVLEHDPKNIEALREIRLHRMRGGAGESAEVAGHEAPDSSFFSKLFGRKKDT